MAIANPTSRGAVETTPGVSATTTVTSTSFAAPANGIAIVAMKLLINDGGANSDFTVSDTFAGTGTWTQAETVVANAGGYSLRTSIWYAQLGATPGTGTITVTRPAGNVDQYMVASFMTTTGVHRTNPRADHVSVVSTATGTTLATTLPGGTPPASALLIGCITNQNGTGAITQPTGFTELTETTNATESNNFETCYKNGSGAATNTWTSGTSGTVGREACMVAFAVAPLGGTLGIATETDSALAITRTKKKTLGIATETDVALPITQPSGHTGTIGTASETDVAVSITRRKIKTIGTAVETDTARPITLSTTPPGAISSVTATAVSPTSATLSYSAPSTGGTPNDYIHEYREGTYPSTTDQASAPTQLTSADGVAGTAYRYRWDGTGVTAFIIGGGIRGTHDEFTGRLGAGFNASSGVADPFHDAGLDNVIPGFPKGHDTAVASVLGGTVAGGAKGVTIYPITLLTPAQSASWDLRNALPAARMIAALQHCLSVAVPGRAVVNISLVGYAAGETDAAGNTITSQNILDIEAAVQDLLDVGIPVVVAAGNQGLSTYIGTHSPMRMTSTGLFSVGNWTVGGGKSANSNYGSDLGWWAPGSGVGTDSAGATADDDSTGAYDGTSEAAPLFSAAVANVLQASNYTLIDLGDLETALDNHKLTATGSLGTGSPTRMINLNSDPDGWITFSDGVSATPGATVTGLTPHTPYVFRVAATNSAGTGPYTISNDIITPQAINTAAETDSALAITHKKTRTLGTAVEVDVAVTITRSKRRAIGVASETDAAGSVARSKNRLVGVASETDIALPITSSSTKIVSVGTATETDSALPIVWAPKNRLVHAALETDTALPVSHAHARLIGAASEVDSAQLIAHAKNRVIGIASEVDVAGAITRVKLHAAGVAIEADVALPIAWAPKNRLVGTALETDTAMSLGGLTTRPITTALETDLALAISRQKMRIIGTSLEVDTAVSISRRPVFRMAVEIDLALPIINGSIPIVTPVITGALTTSDGGSARTTGDEGGARTTGGDFA